MKSVGIICEYNPFHNGHLHHLQETKKRFPGHCVVLVMSGHFLQRGEPSILTKWERSEISLHYGVDLIIELPFLYAVRGADVFARSCVSILNHLGVEAIVFGSESNNISLLKQIAQIDTHSPEFQERLSVYNKQGFSYPRAVSSVIKEITGTEIQSPNDTLGIAYIRAIYELNKDIVPVSIQRTNSFHSTQIGGNIASATSIRKALLEDIDIKKVVPNFTYEKLQKKKLLFSDDYFLFIKYKIFSESDRLHTYFGVDEGIEKRFQTFISSCYSIDEFIEKVKTKRYTYNRLRRILTHLLIGIERNLVTDNPEVPYLRILGFNETGKQYLNFIKRKITIPIVSKTTSFDHPVLLLEKRVTAIYASPLSDKEKHDLIRDEWSKKPIYMTSK